MKGKNKIKLSQLEKQFSELAKDVIELRQTLAKDVEVDVEEVKSELIVGEWYKRDNFGKMMFCFSGKFGNSYETNSNYGFDFNGIYKDELGVQKDVKYIKATPQEVQAALENELTKLGFVEGVKFVNFNGGIQTFLGFADYYGYANGLTCKTPDSEWGKEKCNSNPYIFKDGKFAKIIQQETIKEEEIDWSVPQLLVSSGNNETVYFYNCEMEDKNITVYSVSNSTSFKYPNVFKRQSKSLFKKFKGELTIK